MSFLGGADTYQIDLSIKAFKSGGIFGKGPGQGDLKEKMLPWMSPIMDNFRHAFKDN